MKEQNPIPLWDRICVNANDAARMMSCCRSTFFARVREGIYPKPGPDGKWSVMALWLVHQANSTTKPSAPDAEEGTPPDCKQREPRPSPYGLAGAR